MSPSIDHSWQVSPRLRLSMLPRLWQHRRSRSQAMFHPIQRVHSYSRVGSKPGWNGRWQQISPTLFVILPVVHITGLWNIGLALAQLYPLDQHAPERESWTMPRKQASIFVPRYNHIY